MPNFQGFSENSFDLLKDLKSNNNKIWLDSNRSLYEDLRNRLKILVEDVAVQYIKKKYPTLQTDGKYCLSAIHRQRPTDKGEIYYTYLWAAFYRKSMRNKSFDFQLYVTIHEDFFEDGIYFGNSVNDSFKNKFRQKVRENKTRFIALAQQLPIEFKFPINRDVASHDSLPENVRIEDEETLDSWLESKNLEILRTYDRNNQLVQTAGLVNAIVDDFKNLEEIYDFIYTTYEGPSGPKNKLSLSPKAEEFIEKFKKDPETAKWLERKNKAFQKWRTIFSIENIDTLTREQFKDFLGVNENQSWDGIQRQPSVYADMDKLRTTLKHLVDKINELPLEELKKRLDDILDPNGQFKITRLDRAVVTGIMHICDTKNRLGVWNKKGVDALEKLNIPDLKSTGSRGEQYLVHNNILNTLGKQYGLNLYQVDMLMHKIVTEFTPGKTSENDGDKKIPSISEIISYIESNGFVYPEETIKNYHTSLQTKPFVILSGVTGIGKSKLVELYANGFHRIDKDNRYYKKISVQPNWNDRKSLLGYHNPFTEKYHSTPFLEFLLKAIKDCYNCRNGSLQKCNDLDKCSQRYFLCLDEMNLAYVEYYFADFLSAMETEDKTIDLHTVEIEDDNGNKIPAKIHLPENFFIIGTVNVDETTKSFSPKVLDRANTIDLDLIDLEKWKDIQNKNGKKILEEAFKVIKEIHEILKTHNMAFGYRVCNEMITYIMKSELELDRALDIQIKQKILPKLSGDENLQLRGSLEDLNKFLENSNYPLSRIKIENMIKKLNQQGFTSFYE